MLRFLFVVLLVKSVYCGFFDLTDVDDPLALLWNSRQPNFKLAECRTQTDSGIKFGVCIPHSNCLLSRGKPNGFCGFFSTCCVFESTCGKTSNAKVSYFEGSDETTGGQGACSYTVKLKNANVCQIRLDFVKFNLAPATLLKTVSTTYPIFKCYDDVLRVQPNHYNIPDLCGSNDKQHDGGLIPKKEKSIERMPQIISDKRIFYIHVNQSDGVTKGVQLDITLADRILNAHIQSPSWKIKVTQLECPGRTTALNLPTDEAVQDFPLLAPLGAIQYFTDTTGYIKSFGFDGSVPQQSYTYDQKYAIAFKRDINVCGVKFTPEYIYLQRDNVEFVADTNCKHYLFVPDLYFDETFEIPHNFVSKVCLIEAEVFRSYAPGPLYVHFNSLETNFNTEGTQQQGFNIKYELQNNCP